MSILTGKLIHKPIIVTIRGNVSSGNSPWASQIQKAAETLGYRAEVSDHRVFSFGENYQRDYEKEVVRMSNDNVDIGIIVVGTGSVKNTPFSIEISPQISAPMDILGLLLGMGGHQKDAA